MKKILALACVATLLFACTQQKPKLIISTWGFNEDIQWKNVFTPFEQAHNVTIVLETGNNSERLTKLKVNPNNGIDVIFLAEAYSIQGLADGIYAKLDLAKIPHSRELIARADHFREQGYILPYTVNRLSLAYNPSLSPIPIKSWQDLWNPALAGKVSIPGITTTFGPALVYAAAARAGVPVEQDNAAAAFEQLQQLKPNLAKIYNRTSELINLFSAEEIAVGAAADFSFKSLAEAGEGVVIVEPSDGAFINFNTVGVVKGSDQSELAYMFIDYLLSPEVQKLDALTMGEAPVNKLVKLSAEETGTLTYGAVVDSAVSIDYSYVNSVLKDWIDRWNHTFNQ